MVKIEDFWVYLDDVNPNPGTWPCWTKWKNNPSIGAHYAALLRDTVARCKLDPNAATNPAVTLFYRMKYKNQAPEIPLHWRSSDPQCFGGNLWYFNFKNDEIDTIRTATSLVPDMIDVTLEQLLARSPVATQLTRLYFGSIDDQVRDKLLSDFVDIGETATYGRTNGRAVIWQKHDTPYSYALKDGVIGYILNPETWTGVLEQHFGRIFLTDKFFNLPRSSEDVVFDDTTRRGMVLLHELTHLVIQTKDVVLTKSVAYGRCACGLLGKKNEQNKNLTGDTHPLRNADSLACFAGDLYAIAKGKKEAQEILTELEEMWN